ncbi:replication initiation protein [Thalassomonas viridans]|uniref:Replication initiation protein n=1 Tax=Thalassomonas viridans TaxID=137584 RepID=A0AAE9ZBK5_9GAMM|nr:replication initiation protein [Thalassomonas viridans]WDE09155.1 replication initiation protein [Thalassomonas viridans]
MGQLSLSSAFSAEQEIMSTIWHNAPYAPFCSDNKTVGNQLPRREAFKHPYVQLNPPCNIKFFILDIDHEDESLWNNAQVPAPNAVIRNKNNKKCHLLFRVDDILVKSVKEEVEVRAEPILYANAVYYGLCNKLKADRAAFNNLVSKNPFHPDFNTEFIHSRVYKLKELAEFAEPDWSVYQRGEKENPNPDSRHLSLFHKVRHLAYQQVNQYRLGSDLESFYQRVLKECLAGNHFKGGGFREDENLPASSVKAIAKSIATWTWNNYTGSSCNRGIMKLPHDMEQREKQQRAAGYVAELKRERTIERLKQAFNKLLSTDVKPTQAKVACEAEVSLSTAKRYWQEIKSKPAQDPVVASSNKKVSLAIHKVSFPRDLEAPIFDVAYTYQLSSFLLKQYSSALSLDLSLFNQEFLTSTSHYSFQAKSGRLVESSSSLFNVQTLPKSIRKSVFKGWYEIDLLFSHGQMLLDVMSAHIENVIKPSSFDKQNIWKKLELDSWLQLAEHYADFLNNFDDRLSVWQELSGLSGKALKVALVSYLHGAGKTKFDNQLSGKLSLLLGDRQFNKLIKIFELCRKSIKDLSVKLNVCEARVFKDYWGQVLVIHDGVLVKDFSLAERISASLVYQHTISLIS